MLGVPGSDWRLLFRWTNETIAPEDPEFQRGRTTEQTNQEARAELFKYFHDLSEERRKNPKQDIMSVVVGGKVNDKPIEVFELLSYYLLLVVAGNETTRNAIAWGLVLLTQHPDQRRIWQSDFEAVAPTAVDEIVRWATPVIHFRRTCATAETEIKFADDHPDESRRGTARRVQVALHEVKRQELPPLDDDFAKAVGDFDNLDALRAAVRQDLARAAEREAEAGVREQLVQGVVEANGIEAPPSLVERALHAYLHAYKIPPERQEMFHGEFRPVAEAQVKRELALGALAESHKLFATEADLDGRIKALAEARGVSFNEVYAQLEKAKRLPELERGITEEKVFEFLKSQSTIQEAQS